MEMLKKLRITRHPVIRDSIFQGLSQINVICGPNNSGKSTFISAITSSNVYPAIDNSIDTETIIYNNLISQTGWRGDDSQHGLNTHFRNIVKQTLDEKDWFVNDGELFGKSLRTKFDSNHNTTRWNFPNDSANRVLSIFELNKKIVTIPPKRQLEEKVEISPSTDIKPNGHGLLSFLFSAKNQSSISDDRKLFHNITNAFEQITAGLKFEIFMVDHNLVLNFSPRNEYWLNASQCGLGLQDLLVILYYSEVSEIDILCIEEPENHLHPDIQRKLLIYLRSKNDKQFFLTTHSNVFLNNALIDKVLVTAYKNDQISVSDVTSKASVLDDLGYSVADNLVSDLVILVEGPTDVPVIEELLLKKKLFGSYNIKIWPLGGDIMDQLDLDVLASNNQLIALIDKDPGSSKVRNRFATKCADKNVPLIVLKRYAIENYFSLRVLKEIFGSQIAETIEVLDHNKTLESQIGINVKKNNRKLARSLTLEEINDTDLGKFLTQVETLCKL